MGQANRHFSKNCTLHAARMANVYQSAQQPTAHSLFSYPVEDENDVDDQDLATCDFNKERCDYLHEVSVIFWDEFISNDRIIMEAVLEEFKTRWEEPRYYIFVCAGDFAHVCIYPLSSIHITSVHMNLFLVIL